MIEKSCKAHKMGVEGKINEVFFFGWGGVGRDSSLPFRFLPNKDILTD